MFKILDATKSKYFSLYLLAIINFFIAYLFLKRPPFIFGDSVSYWNALDFLSNGLVGGDVPLNRLLTTPLMIFSSLAVNFFLGNYYLSMLVINIIFYILVIYFFYNLSNEIYNNDRTAKLSSFLFISNYCIISFGLAYLADMGGWFFFIMSSFFAVKYYKSKAEKFFYFSIISASTGFLFKEYGALGMVSLGLLIFLSGISLKEKIRKVFLSGVVFAAIPLVYHLLFYYKFNYSYFDWYFYNISQYAHGPLFFVIKNKIILLIKVLGWVFLAGWPIFFYGLWQEKKYFNRERAKILLALSPASLLFLVWPALDQRMAFILVPWLALISGFGLSKIKNKYLVAAFLLFYLLINYNTFMLIRIINLPF